MDAVSLVSPVLRGPFTGRARREVAFCVLTLPFGVFIPLAGFFATVDAGLLLGSGPPWVADGNPSGQAVAAAVGVAALLTVPPWKIIKNCKLKSWEHRSRPAATNSSWE